MNAYDRLAYPLKQYIYEQGWKRLRPIQEAAIQMCYSSDHNLILCAPTASGKTEAAFLPAISQANFQGGGVRILMVSPLIALINDQFRRIHELCQAFDLPIVAWHGEANASKKKKLLKDPRGILMITPESLEAMLDLHPGRVETLLSSVEFIIVDELHAFLSGERGVQLRSLLERVRETTGSSPRYFGLSATLAEENYPDAKSFFPSDRPCALLLDRGEAPLEYDLHFFPRAEESEGDDAVTSLQWDALYRQASEENLLVFPNSRSRVELIADAIKRRAAKEGRALSVFAHHSSVEKELRKEAEEFVRRPHARYVICATSTLELGIDIGTVDAVAQVEAPYSAIQLSQRLGRSGRGEVLDPKTGRLVPAPRRLHLHVSDDFSLLQSLAALAMVKEGKLDAFQAIPKPYDLFAHQLLGRILQYNGLTEKEIHRFVTQSALWSFLEEEELDLLLEDLLEREILELLPAEEAEYIIGLRGESITGRYDFFACFPVAREYRVLHGKQEIGHLPLSPEMIPGAKFLLSARVWKISSIEDRIGVIHVEEAGRGKAPSFGGGEGTVSSALRREMAQQLVHPSPDWLQDALCSRALDRLQDRYCPGLVLSPEVGPSGEEYYTVFLGTAMERTLFLLLRSVPDAEVFWDPRQARLYGKELGGKLHRLHRALLEDEEAIYERVESYLMEQETLRKRLLNGVKYAFLLPSLLQARYIRYNLMVEGCAWDFLP